MIRTNLSTRPFYNERAVNLLLGGVAAIAIVATLFNVTRYVQLRAHDSGLSSQIALDEQRAADLRSQAARLRATIDPKQIELVTNEARKANELIDRRTFSWTELFNWFETTLPEDVRITSVRPKVDNVKGTTLTITIVAKTIEDAYQFMANLEATGAFSDMIPKDDRYNEQGQVESIVEMSYNPAGPKPAATPSPAPTPKAVPK
jgi:type IV pilus assembly protein PilN